MIKNTVRNKFQPPYGPETMTVTVTENHGTWVILTRENGKTMRRHVDDIKTLPTDENDQNIEVDNENEIDMTPPLADNTGSLEKVHEGARRSVRNRKPNPKHRDYVY